MQKRYFQNFVPVWARFLEIDKFGKPDFLAELFTGLVFLFLFFGAPILINLENSKYTNLARRNKKKIQKPPNSFVFLSLVFCVSGESITEKRKEKPKMTHTHDGDKREWFSFAPPGGGGVGVWIGGSGGEGGALKKKLLGENQGKRDITNFSTSVRTLVILISDAIRVFIERVSNGNIFNDILCQLHFGKMGERAAGSKMTNPPSVCFSRTTRAIKRYLPNERTSLKKKITRENCN